MIWLRRFFLPGMALVFAGMIAALEVLNYYSGRNQGLATELEDQHYLWTYGPTLVLTGVAIVWARVEYGLAQVMPWLLLKRNSSARSANGLLIDYVTPFSVVSLFQSLQRKHFPVTLGFLGGLVLKALIVVSTGLLAPQTIERDGVANYTTVSQFNLSALSRETVVDSGVTIWSIKNQSMPFPPGTTSTFATQVFKPADVDSPTSLTVAANVSVFEATANCQAYSWQIDTALVRNTSHNIEEYLPAEDVAQLAPYCIIGLEGTVDLEFGNFTSSGSDRIETLRVLDLCPNSAALDDGDTHRLFFPFRYDLSANTTGVSALLCRPAYSITRRQMSTAGMGTAISQDWIDMGETVLSNISIGVKPLAVTFEITASVGNVLLDAVGAGSGDQYNQVNGWYGIMNLTSPRASLQVYRNMSYFRDTFESAYQSAAALAINTRATVPDNATIAGNIVYLDSRLVIVDVSLRAMETLLGVMTIACLSLCFYNYSGLPGNLGSLLTAASVLSRSDDLRQLLRGSGSQGLHDLRRALSGLQFESTTVARPGREVRIQLQGDIPVSMPQVKISTNRDVDTEWWMPTAASLYFRVGLICFSFILVGALEILLQLSRAHSGLLNVPNEGYIKYTWLFLPTLLASCITLAFGAVGTSAKMLHPYQELRRSRLENQDALEFDPLSRVALVSMPRSLRRGYWGLSAAMFLSVLSPFLTIAASGLYTAQFVPGAQPMDIPLSEWFDLRNATTADGIALMNGDLPSGPPTKDAVFNMAVQFNNLSFPAGTYDEFAFAQIDASSLLPLLEKVNTSTTTLQVRIPAIRGELNCTTTSVTEAAESQPSLSKRSSAVFPGLVSVEIPPGCTPDTVPSNHTVLQLVRQGGFDSAQNGFFGYWADTIWMAPNSTDVFDRRDPFSVCNDARQHIFFFYGHCNKTTPATRAPLIETADQLDILHCMPYVEAMYVDATLALPSLNIDPTASPPTPVDGSIMMWDATNASANTLPFPGMAAAVNLDTNLEGIFAALVRGYQAQPAEEIIGGRNATRMIGSLNHLFRQMVAQSLHFNYRASLSRPRASTRRRRAETTGAFGTTSVFVEGPAAGVLLDAAQTRLVQSDISTRLLQALLVVFVLCTALVCILTGDSRVVPKNPGSLAARMSLFADGDIPRRIAEWSSLPERHSLLEEGESFTLGWWYPGGNREEKKYYGIGVWKNEARIPILGRKSG
ncbi:hypothetical protein GQ53DRAFT_718706 [Thozetella sp. PMI_491]|nr:hypothetical protein GQ53DRAFT_718706 [Thozetella sp. PMI_491]